MQIAAGLHRIGSGPTAASSTATSSSTDDGVTVVDAGLPRYSRLLEQELASIGRSLDDIRALVLTHGDSDHIGFASWLHRERGIPAHVHEADVDRARLEVKKPNTGWGR
jgi:glyoxylase-like metal-dependent hydrolase (beta-lactamase superfamily II)